MAYRKKLIEVSLPLEAINREAAREKSIRHGHPSTLHLWRVRRSNMFDKITIVNKFLDNFAKQAILALVHPPSLYPFGICSNVAGFSFQGAI